MAMKMEKQGKVYQQMDAVICTEIETESDTSTVCCRPQL